jgi:myosin-crossreactive antigen
MDTQLSKVAAGEKTRLFKSMTGNLKHLVGMARSLNFTDNKEIAAIADGIEEHLLQYEVDAYKDNAALARASAKIAKGIHARASEDSTWRVTNGDEDVVTNPIVDSTQEPDTTVEVEVQEPEEVNEQTEEDQEFLASLATPIGEDPDEKTVPVVEEESEEKSPVSETPDFDPDDVMFSS